MDIYDAVLVYLVTCRWKEKAVLLCNS